MKQTGETDDTLAPKLALAPSTLNNFLNRHSERMDGHAVALACTLMNLVCAGEEIGKISYRQNGQPTSPPEQLVLEFDDSFEISGQSEHPTLLLRKPLLRNESVRILVKRIG